MEVRYSRCAGLDVHAKTVVGCVRIAAGATVRYERRTVSTTTRGRLDLMDRLTAQQVTHVAMEATGVYWKPVWQVLEGHVTLVLAIALHIHTIPGRKRDQDDATWIADRLALGLIRSSVVHAAPLQDLRDLTRTRTQLVREAHAAEPEDPRRREYQAHRSDQQHPGHLWACCSAGPHRR